MPAADPTVSLSHLPQVLAPNRDNKSQQTRWVDHG